MYNVHTQHSLTMKACVYTVYMYYVVLSMIVDLRSSFFSSASQLIVHASSCYKIFKDILTELRKYLLIYKLMFGVHIIRDERFL